MIATYERAQQHWRAAPPPQGRLWSLHQLDARTVDSFVPLALAYEGLMPVHLLQQTLGEVVRRHSVLRWQFRRTPDGLELTERPATLPVVSSVDVRRVGGSASAWRPLVRCVLARPFALEDYPLFRFLHVRLGARTGLVLGVLHHALADGWSMAVLGAELEALWEETRRGQASPLPDLEVQYVDLWSGERASRHDGSREWSLAYWKASLRSLDHANAWPWPRLKSGRFTARVLRCSERLDAAESAALRKQAGQLRASPFLLFLAVLSVLRWRLSGSTAAVIGTDTVGRTEPRAEKLIGFFVNVLPLRIDIDPRDTFADHLASVRRQFLTAYEHQHVGYDEIVRAVGPPRDGARNPLFNVKLMMQNFPDHQLQLPGLRFASVPSDPQGSFEDVKVFVRPAGGSYELHWEAKASCFSGAEVAALARQFRHLIRQVVASSAVSLRRLILEAESAAAPEILEPRGVRGADGERGDAGYDTARWSARENDPRPFVHASAGSFTVGAFSQRVTRVAAGLRALGVGPGVLVGLYIRPSADLLASACAVLAAGGGIVFVDPRDTPERAGASLRAAGPAVVLVGDGEREPDAGAGARLLRIRHAARAATSGQPTTRPPADGVAFVDVHQTATGDVEAYRFTYASVSAQMAAWTARWRGRRGTFVVSTCATDLLALIADLSVCLEQQRTLLLCDDLAPVVADAHALGDCCYLRVDASALPQQLPPKGSGRTPAGDVVVEGRAAPAWCAALHRAWPGAHVHVVTRLPGVALAASHFEWDAAWNDLCRLPAGNPVGAARLHLLDGWMQPVPLTGVGEIYASGAVAQAMHGDPERTAQRLVPSPAGDGGRWLKTGIRGARLADGQIAIAGPRRMLARTTGTPCDALWIESLLLEHAAVADAVALRVDSPHPPRVVAFVTVHDAAPTEDDLWTLLSGRLTRASLPDAIRIVATLPIDASGRAIPGAHDGRRDRPSPAREHTELRSRLEAIWRELLEWDGELGPDDDFFDVGGDSVLAIRLAYRIEEQFGVECRVGDVFTHRTLSLLAERLASAAETADPAVPLERLDANRLLPVASAQNRLLFLHRLNPSTSAYNCPAALELRGRPSLPLITQCVAEIVRRHDTLRTVFLTVDGEFRQLVLPNAGWRPTHVDLGALRQPDVSGVAARLRRADVRRPFALQEAPAVRAMTAHLGGNVWELALTVHHVISDAWSQRLLIEEFSGLAARYLSGLPSGRPALPFQYGDYAMWQAKRLQGRHLTRLMDEWADLTTSADFEPIHLGDRVAVNGRRRVGYQRFTIPPSLQGRLHAACQGRGATLYILLLAAFQCLLHRVTGRASTTVMASAANRYPREMNDVIGFFANTFPVASRWRADDTVLTLLERTRDYLLRALRLQELPFDRIVEGVRRTRPDVDPSRLNVSFVMTPALDAGVSIPGAVVRSLITDDVHPKFDLEIQLNASESGIAGSLEYSTAFLTDDGADALRRQYVQILEEVAASWT